MDKVSIVNKQKRWMQVIWLCIIVIAISARVIEFGKVPGGIHLDEAYAGYEAWSLLNYGIDSVFNILYMSNHIAFLKHFVL